MFSRLVVLFELNLVFLVTQHTISHRCGDVVAHGSTHQGPKFHHVSSGSVSFDCVTTV